MNKVTRKDLLQAEEDERVASARLQEVAFFLGAARDRYRSAERDWKRATERVQKLRNAVARNLDR